MLCSGTTPSSVKSHAPAKPTETTSAAKSSAPMFIVLLTFIQIGPRRIHTATANGESHRCSQLPMS